MTYEEFKQSLKEPEYFGLKCFVAGCNKPAEFEIRDARYYCGACEEHARIFEKWTNLKKHSEKKWNNSPKLNIEIDYKQFNF